MGIRQVVEKLPLERFVRMSTEENGSNAVEQFKQLRQQRTEVLKQMEQLASAAFSAMARELFEKIPLIKSFSWTQYTPYFNDGDTCEFSANTDYPRIVYTDGKYLNGKKRPGSDGMRMRMRITTMTMKSVIGL